MVRRAAARVAIAALLLAGCSMSGVVDQPAPGDRPDASRPGGAIDAAPPDADVDRPCKRGVSYTRERADDRPAMSTGIGWWYNWAPIPDQAAYEAFRADGAEFVPMIWTGPPRAPINVDDLIERIPDDARYLLGFNEPNFGVQANLTPEEAAAAWPLVEAIARARNLTLVSPAVNYCGGDCNETDPIVWLDAFFEACEGCRVDHVALHWYACTRDALDFIVDRFEKYGKPLWLTEFSCLDSADISVANQRRYMAEALPYLEAHPLIFRYAWFIARADDGGDPYDLFTAAPGGLTDLGWDYTRYNDTCP